MTRCRCRRLGALLGSPGRALLPRCRPGGSCCCSASVLFHLARPWLLPWLLLGSRGPLSLLLPPRCLQAFCKRFACTVRGSLAAAGCCCCRLGRCLGAVCRCAGLLGLGPRYWPGPVCQGFTGRSWAGAVVSCPLAAVSWPVAGPVPSVLLEYCRGRGAMRRCEALGCKVGHWGTERI